MIQTSFVGIYILTTAGFLLVLGEVRILTRSDTQNYLRRRLGSHIDITCSSTDGSSVTWQYEGVSIEPDERHLMRNLNHEGSVSQLTIVNAQVNDSGLYKCRNKRKQHESDQLLISIAVEDSDSHHARLPAPRHEKSGHSFLHFSRKDRRSSSSRRTQRREVTFNGNYHELGVEIVNPPDSFLAVDTGSSFTLRCIGYNGAILEWFHNGTRLIRSRQIIITSSHEVLEQIQITLLTRNSVHEIAAGSYECRDLLSSYLSDNVTIKVQKPERTKVPVEIFQPPSKLNRVRPGTSFEIKCKANITSNLVWFFNDIQLLENNRNSVRILSKVDRDAQRNTSTLIVSNATKRDSGKYSCCNLKDTEDLDYAMIFVDEDQDSGSSFESGIPPPTVPTSVIMQIGSVTNLQCSFQAPGDYRLEWTKDERILTNGEKYVIHQDSKTISLGIRFTERSDVGIYRCTFSHISYNRTAGAVVFNVTTIPCPALEPPRNGHLVRCPPQPVFGETCSFGCNHGYQISNDVPVVCERNVTGETYWSADLPQCTANLMISNDSLVPTTVSNVLLRIGTSLRLQCIGSTIWTKHDHPIENSAKKYAIEANSLTIHDTGRNDAGIYECSIYKDELLIGTNKFNVTSLACPDRPLLPHGSVDGCSEEPVFGESCVFRCDAGYAMRGSRLRSCEIVGNETVPYWTGDQAECLGPAKPVFNYINSATSSNIPAKLCIFETTVVFRLDQQRILAVISTTMLLLPHFLHW